jgi:hypothetical protein
MNCVTLRDSIFASSRLESPASPTHLQVGRLVEVRPKIVHGRVRMAAYSCVMPLNEERAFRPHLPLPSVSPHDEIPVRRS